jgi:hypothetical protein
MLMDLQSFSKEGVRGGISRQAREERTTSGYLLASKGLRENGMTRGLLPASW